MATQKPESVPKAYDSKQADRLLDAFRQELDALGSDFYHYIDVKSFPSVQTILGLSLDQQVPVVLEAIARQTEQMRQFGSHDSSLDTTFSWNHCKGFKELISVLLRKNLPFRVEDIGRLVLLVSGGRGYYSWQLSLGGILRALENFCREGGIPDCLRPRLVALRDKLHAQPAYAAVRDAVKRLDQLLTPAPVEVPDSLLTTEEAWTRYLRGQLDDLAPSSKTA